MPIFRRKDESFFKAWSPSMTYVLGFFAADGSMSKNKRGACFIDFTSTDRIILDEIKKVMHSNLKIGVYQAKNNNASVRYHLQIGSKRIFNDILKLGFTPRKSGNMQLPPVPKRNFRHFVRGYFDGDGNVYVAREKRAILCGFTSGSREFLKELWTTLKRYKVVAGGTLFYHPNGYRLYFSVRDSRSLYEYMYGSGVKSLYLPRKKKVFEKYFGIG
jgi:intein-encoded DNA endonuclease-like protein